MLKKFLYAGLLALAVGSYNTTKTDAESDVQTIISRTPPVEKGRGYGVMLREFTEGMDKAIEQYPINWNKVIFNEGTTLFQYLMAQPGFMPPFAPKILSKIKESVGPVQFTQLAQSVNALGQTPLYRAVAENNVKLVEFLLESYPEFKATINTSTTNGKSPLYKAAENGNLEMVNTLLAHGANVALQTKQSPTTQAGYTAYDIAYEKRNEPTAAAIAGWAAVKNKAGFANKHKPAMVK